MRRNLSITFGLCAAGLLAIMLPLVADDHEDEDHTSNAAGAIYTMTNGIPNAVMVYERSAMGTLKPGSQFPTGGNGTGSGLGNQGAVILSRNNRWLFVVNAGSDEVTVFKVLPNGLQLADRVPSGGTTPVSLTVHGRLIYVLHAGMPNNITGFKLAPDGKLTPLAGSTRALSAPMTGPAQVQFSPDGDLLVVTEKDTNIIDVFPVEEGLPGPRVPTTSNGTEPFGFSFGPHDNKVFVSEAFGGALEASAVSSYSAEDAGTLTLVTGSAKTNQTAACWVIVTNNGRFAYTSNTGSGSICGYRISHDGRLTILNADGRTGVTGPGSSPIDLALSLGSRFLYSLNSGNHTISAFHVSSDGSLALLGVVPAPATANGLAGR